MLINVQIFVYFFLVSQFFKCSIATTATIHEINEAVFLDPRSHTALIRCPLDYAPSSDIQWYDVANHRYELERGRFFRINGSNPFDREFICSTVAQTGVGHYDKYRIKVRTYGKIKNQIKY